MTRIPATRTAAAAIALVATLACGLGALAPAAASADHYLGSKLNQAPTVAQMFPTDTTFWQTGLSSASGPALAFQVPQDGQIIQIYLRGYVGGGFGAQPIHFQVLRPQANGTLKIIASSQKYMLPGTDGTWPYEPVNFCVKTGDYIGFSTEGGFNATSSPMGVPFQVFAPASGSSTAYFTKNNGVQNHDLLTPTTVADTELLMSAYEGTGAHASPLCGGIEGIELVAPSQTDKVSSAGRTTVRVECNGPLRCNGRLALSVPPATADRPPASQSRGPSAGAAATAAATLGGASFSISSHGAANVPVHVSSQTLSLLRSSGGRLSVIASLSAGSGGPDNTTTSTIMLSS